LIVNLKIAHLSIQVLNRNDILKISKSKILKVKIEVKI
jgi:hypothetical protein